jgi:hypothetical protein
MEERRDGKIGGSELIVEEFLMNKRDIDQSRKAGGWKVGLMRAVTEITEMWASPVEWHRSSGEVAGRVVFDDR